MLAGFMVCGGGVWSELSRQLDGARSLFVCACVCGLESSLH